MEKKKMVIGQPINQKATINSPKQRINADPVGVEEEKEEAEVVAGALGEVANQPGKHMLKMKTKKQIQKPRQIHQKMQLEMAPKQSGVHQRTKSLQKHGNQKKKKNQRRKRIQKLRNRKKRNKQQMPL